MTDCLSCRILAAHSPREVYRDGEWAISLMAGAMPAIAAGWSVLTPVRHVERLADLTLYEVERMGPLLRTCDAVYPEALGARGLFVARFGENPKFHFHFHLVPTHTNDPAWRGPRIMLAMDAAKQGEIETVSEEDILAMAAKLHAAIWEGHP